MCTPGAMEAERGSETATRKKASDDLTTPFSKSSWAISEPVSPAEISIRTDVELREVRQSKSGADAGPDLISESMNIVAALAVSAAITLSRGFLATVLSQSELQNHDCSL